MATSALRRPRRRRGAPLRPFRRRRALRSTGAGAGARSARVRADVRMIDAAGRVVELRLPDDGGPLNLSR